MIAIAQTPVKTLLFKSKISGFDYVINPYVGCPHRCVYCYAEYMRKFSGHSEEWGDFLDVKQCPVPLKPGHLFRTRVMLSSVTDPYNPYEEKYQATRQVLKQLVYCQAKVYILTKSPLVLRDIDLLKQLYQCEVAFSFSSADEEFRKVAEPGAAPVAEKIQALKTLHEAGLRTAIMAAPLLPGISDWRAIVEQTRPYTDRYGFDSLNMRPAYQRKVMDFVELHYPQALKLMSKIYVEEDRTYWKELGQEIRRYCSENNLPADIYFDTAAPFSGAQ